MWTARLKGVPEHVDHTAVFIQGKLYSFDLDNVVTESRNIIDVYIFDPSSYRWDMVRTQLLPNDAPLYICRHTVVAYGHCAYIWGGDRGITPNKLYRFDTRTMAWSRPKVHGEVPTAVCGHSACVINNRMYIFATILRGDPSHPAWFLDLESMKWHRVPISAETPVEPCFHTASAIGTRMYIWGSYAKDPSRVYGVVFDDALYYLETTTSTWVRPHVEGVPPADRMEHSAFVYNGELYIFGGYSFIHRIYYADMHKYDPKASRWTEVKQRGSGPAARHFHSCCATGERVFIFGGFGPMDNQVQAPLLDLHILHLEPTLKNLCILAAVDAGLDISRLPPIIRNDINAVISGQS